MFKRPNFSENPKLAGLRNKLVKELKAKGISSPAVLDAIAHVPRHLFFPSDFENFAYRDAAFPIGNGQTISQPYTVAFQSQLLQIFPGEKVLEIGTGSGYQAAVLSTMGAEVHSIELIKALVISANRVLKILDIPMKTYVGDGTLGLPSQKPFDAIIVTAGAPSVPETLIKQLKINGRLVIPVGDEQNIQKMYRITRTSLTETKTEVFGDFKFVPLLGENGWTMNS